MLFKKTILIFCLTFPFLASATVSVPKDSRLLLLVRECSGLMKELQLTARQFNTLARINGVSTTTLQGDFNQILVDVRLILEKGGKGKCNRAFESVEYRRQKTFDYYDYEAQIAQNGVVATRSGSFWESVGRE